MSGRKKHIKKLYRALESATSYAEWLETAEVLDEVEGNLEWRETPESPHYDHELIAEHLQDLRDLRRTRDMDALRDFLETSLHRNLGDLSDPALYTYAHGGTKRLIEDYLDEVEVTLTWLCDDPIPGYPDEAKLGVAREAARVFGRSALLLSGGGALGLFHLGVVKALWEHDLLPMVISGASMGAIVAGGVCVRNDDELEGMWSNVEAIHRVAVRLQSPAQAWRDRSLLSPEQLHEHIESNLGNLTFKEAFDHSGRVLNVAVSPTRHRQKPRLLSHLTSPDVLIDSATLASCSIPGLFPPSELERRDAEGRVRPYVEGEAWIDGSLHGDVPTMRLGRLHNVNHVIVSQTNVHVVPFAKLDRSHGLLPAAVDAATSGLRAQSRQMLALARRRLSGSLWNPTLEWMYTLAHQNYQGHINIHPRLRIRDYARVMKNPSLTELEGFIHGGERATWPKIAMIRDQTRISRTLERCVQQLSRRVASR